MAELVLDGYTLGQKQQHYNSLIQDAIKNNKTVNIEDFNSDDSDIINLMNIDIASQNKNVEYILKVLTCEDMLYVSKAIKQSNWLVNDPTYMHIINPKYIRTNLIPQMCSKAILKLMKHIRNNLNNEKRAEEFYSSEENPEEAVKWLPHCSLEFVQENVAKHTQHMKSRLLRRLCEKSIVILEIYIKNEKTSQKKRTALQATIFLLSSNVDKFLDIVEENEFPSFNKKATTVLMKNNSNRVIDKFDKYYNFIHLPTFFSCLKHENVKDFLITQVQKFKDTNLLYRFISPKRIFLFIQSMPHTVRFEFVKQLFIDKIHESPDTCILSEEEIKAMTMLCNITSHHFHSKIYTWYQFAPFNIALQKIQELMEPAVSTYEKIFLLDTLMTSAQNNLSDELIFLDYLKDQQKNLEFKVKEEILKKLILKNNFVYYDVTTWNVVDDIFKEIDIYVETKNSECVIIDAIILYNIIHNENVSPVVENKFKFNSLLQHHKNLDEKQKEMVFLYLYGVITANLTKCNVTNENEFKEKINILKVVLTLLKDYKKELENYPTIICSIKNLVKTKTDLSLTVSMEPLFNIKKTWRKLLFDESLVISQTESALLNVLKHGPSLIEHNEVILQTMLCNEKMTFQHVLNKIKIYWPSTFAKNIITMYTGKLYGLGDHKATTRGLSILLPPKHLQQVIEKYTPNEGKIDWANIDEIELSIQQQFAKNMHRARPQPSPDIILRFAKGDYLQYALPSLLAIFYNLNSLSSQKYILQLLDAPVSLQKHGIRLAVSKIELEQLLFNFSNIWKNNKNASIRSVMFKNVYNILCKEKDLNKIKGTWEVMEMFIDNLTFQEDKAIYKLLFKIKKVPLEVRAKFYTKSYIFLHRLLNSGGEFKEYEHQFYSSFTSYSREIMEQLNENFIVEIIVEYVEEEFTKQKTELWSRGCVTSIISSYLLSVSDEQTQIERYDKVFLPILKKSFNLWNSESFIKNNLSTLLNSLRSDLKQYVIEKKVIPIKMFSLIQEELNQALEIPENYMLLTKWKLTVTFVSVLSTHQPLIFWKDICKGVASEFGNKCINYLKEDCNKHFPRIYVLFVKALGNFLKHFIPEIAYWGIYRNFIQDDSFTQGYLAAIKLSSKRCNLGDDRERREMKKVLAEVCKHICDHPSNEIKMHYYNYKKQINMNMRT